MSMRTAMITAIAVAMAPGLVVGSLVGPQIASALPFAVMAVVFGTFTWLTALRMVRSRPPKVTRTLPGKPAMAGMGAVIGLFAGMVGTGGAFLAVPFLTRCNVKVHTAVASSAAMGLPIATAATMNVTVENGSAGKTRSKIG